MPNDLRHTKRQLPVLIGGNYEHVMAKAEVLRTPTEVTITITGDGREGQLLAEYLEQVEPIALSFVAIPVRNIREKKEKT